MRTASPTSSRVPAVPRSLTMLLGDERGRFSGRRAIDVAVIAAPGGLAAGDINDNGVDDVALISDSDTVSVLIGDGAGGLVTMTHLTLGRVPPRVVEAAARRAGPPGPAATTSDLPSEYQGFVSLTLNPTTIRSGGCSSNGGRFCT
jgi:hypothetical protein